MKYKVPSLTCAICLCVLLLLASLRAGEDVGPPADSNALLAAAASNLRELPAIEAKLRQRVRLFGHEMVGSGSYQQMTAGRQRMVRLELKMDVAGQVTSFQQISDGTTLWIRRDSREEQRIDYVNLRQLRQSLARLAPAPTPSPGNDWLALGGLDQLLDQLGRNFSFAAPVASQIGSVPVWELTGSWKPQALQQLGVETAEELPLHLPHVVKVTLGRDEQLPLFPYRIEYGRQLEKSDFATAAAPSPQFIAIAAMDLHGVQRRPDLAARHFQFQPNDQEVLDVTDRYLQQLTMGLSREAP